MNKQIEQVMKQLEIALIENIEASKTEIESKQRKIKAHYNLQKAREELNAVIGQFSN